jgi:hypothetical protein
MSSRRGENLRRAIRQSQRPLHVYRLRRDAIETVMFSGQIASERIGHPEIIL